MGPTSVPKWLKTAHATAWKKSRRSHARPLHRHHEARLGVSRLHHVVQVSHMRIPIESYRLSNGLVVTLSEDHRAPIVAVNLWYRVGSANERLGRTGFAHLFEHMLFQGS